MDVLRMQQVVMNRVLFSVPATLHLAGCGGAAEAAGRGRTMRIRSRLKTICRRLNRTSAIPAMILSRAMNVGLRTVLCTAAIVMLSAVSGCVPITLATEKVEPTVAITDTAPDWHSLVGPDVRQKFVSDVRHAIQAKRKDVEFVEPDLLWAESFPHSQPGSLQESAELIDNLNSGEAAHLGLCCLIVLGPRLFVDHDSSNDNPFYSSGLQRTSLQAVILRWNPVDAKPRLVQSAAQGIEREGWIPGTPLIFTRLYKKVGTDESALRGLVNALLDEIGAGTAAGPLRVAILAEVDDKTASKKP